MSCTHTWAFPWSHRTGPTKAFSWNGMRISSATPWTRTADLKSLETLSVYHAVTGWYEIISSPSCFNGISFLSLSAASFFYHDRQSEPLLYWGTLGVHNSLVLKDWVVKTTRVEYILPETETNSSPTEIWLLEDHFPFWDAIESRFCWNIFFQPKKATELQTAWYGIPNVWPFFVLSWTSRCKTDARLVFLYQKVVVLCHTRTPKWIIVNRLPPPTSPPGFCLGSTCGV